MSGTEPDGCELIDGRGLECSECGQEPRIARRTRFGFDRLCLACARTEHNAWEGVSRSLVQLVEAEHRWAADIAAELFGGSAHRAGTAPWVSWDAEREPYRVLPTGFRQVEPDPIGLRWVTSQGKNFGRCGECGARGPELIGVNVAETRGSATLERTCCRGCAVRLTEDAAALMLAVTEAEAAERVRAERAACAAQREQFGFVPIVWLPPMEAVA